MILQFCSQKSGGLGKELSFRSQNVEIKVSAGLCSLLEALGEESVNKLVTVVHQIQILWL